MRVASLGRVLVRNSSDHLRHDHIFQGTSEFGQQMMRLIDKARWYRDGCGCVRYPATEREAAAPFDIEFRRRRGGFQQPGNMQQG